MNIAALLILLLSHDGYWIGGSANEISVEWAAATVQMPAADLSWELKLGAVPIASGQTPVAPQGRKTVVRITPPEVRVRIAARWQYTLKARADAKELDRGELPIVIFPRNLTQGLARRIASSRIAVWDDGSEMVKVLDEAKAPFQRYEDASRLGLARADAILVGADTLDASPFDQGPLISLAGAGASVMIFRQSRCNEMGSFSIVRRSAPAAIDWMIDHPLLHGMDEVLLRSLTKPFSNFLPVRLSAEGPALAIGAWPREVPGNAPVPIDALLVSKSMGNGRLVFCQVQLGDWRDDPRSQLFLVNAIDYLLTPPQPTSAKSQRPSIGPMKTHCIPTITIPPGNEP